MADVTLETDYWVESSDPISNLETDYWNFELVAPPYVTFKTDLWYFADSPYNSNLYPQTAYLTVADTDGMVQIFNIGKSDNETPIEYELETQGIEFGNIFHRKKVSDNLVAFTKNGIDSYLEATVDNNSPKQIPFGLNNRVNIGEDVKLEGNAFKFKWSGVANETSPVFEGLYAENITNLGITKG